MNIVDGAVSPSTIDVFTLRVSSNSCISCDNRLRQATNLKTSSDSLHQTRAELKFQFLGSLPTPF